MMQTRPYLLLTTARSGSTPVYEILKNYFYQNYEIQGAHSIMNPRFGTYDTIDGKLVYDPSASDLKGRNVQEVYEIRAKLVKEFHGKIFFKIYPDEFKGEFGYWLMSHFNFITIERQNLVEQILSFLISSTTQIWYRPDGINLPEKSLTADKLAFSNIEGALYVFRHLKKTLKPSATLVYEDFVKLSAKDFLYSNGFTESFDSSTLKLPPKQNHGDKRRLFTNSHEIEQWYKSSWLNEEFPWNL